MSANLQTTYNILKRFVRNGSVRSYTDLSNEYLTATGNWVEPHGSWDMVLDGINKRLEATHPHLPPISALIINQATARPGLGCWNSCARTRNVASENRDEVWAEIVRDVMSADYPVVLPL